MAGRALAVRAAAGLKADRHAREAPSLWVAGCQVLLDALGGWGGLAAAGAGVSGLAKSRFRANHGDFLIENESVTRLYIVKKWKTT